MMRTSLADVPTEHATSYLRQLCRHWAHRFPVTFDDQKGRVELPSALCLLAATPTQLQVRLELAEDVEGSRVEQVVAEHLQRFGFKEQLVFDWRHA